MTELIPTINKIVRFGLEPNLEVDKDCINTLEKSMIKIYSLYFDINYEFDNSDFKEYHSHQYADIRKNIESNFPDFGFYNIVIDLIDLDSKNIIAVGDAADDLTDIILDLLRIKWRIENNSINDGLWYFQFIFFAHTQQHIIDLLNFLKNRK